MTIENVRAVYFPYCIEKQQDESWVLLNRNYKPVGFNTNEFIRYEEYPVSIKLKNLNSNILKKLSYKDGELGNRIYLYDNDCVPTSSKQAMSEYLAKLEILLKLKTSEPN